MTQRTSRDVSEVWKRVSRDVGPGWEVLQFDPSTGESIGTVEAPPELEDGVFRVSVRWNVRGEGFEGVVEARVNRRTIRYVDCDVLMSSVGNTWLFRPPLRRQTS